MNLKTALLRILLYFGIAIAALAVMAVIVIFSARTGFTIPIRWIGLTVYTAAFGYFIVRQNRNLTRNHRFWLLFSTIMTVHLVGFSIVLHYMTTWRLIWFNPTTLIEIIGTIWLIGIIFDKPKHRSS